ncbi:MAG: PHP domain-containing protein [Anaerolineales bacterium]|nr:PHP domain-containing protein [Anaerolineales bacterium]
MTGLPVPITVHWLLITDHRHETMNYIDLHCHTTASDGLLSPTRLVESAAEVSLQTIAVTDHDSTEGLAEAIEAGARLGIEIIPGVELSCDVPAGELHMLGYFMDYHAPGFQAELQRLREGRIGRAEGMARRLTDLGYPVSFERIQELAGDGAIGRPHVAQALIEAGHVRSKAEAFDRFIGRTGPAYVERAKLSPVEACQLIRSVGGLPVFAHPLIVLMSGRALEPLPVDESLPDLVAAGLAGLEVYYPYYTPVHIDRLLALARRYNLLTTGGSDFHGAGSAGAPLGSIYVPRKCLTALQDARRVNNDQ